MGTRARAHISRREVIEKALQILDADGVEGLNIRRLGTELGVNGASLYYHYRSKDDILEDVVRAVYRGLRLPDPEADDWLDWLVQCNAGYRRALVSHPNVVPLLLRGDPGRHRPEAVRQFLGDVFVDAGAEPEDLEWVLKVLGSFTIGLILVGRSTGRVGGGNGPHEDDSWFEDICGGLIELLLDAARGHAASST